MRAGGETGTERCRRSHCGVPASESAYGARNSPGNSTLARMAPALAMRYGGSCCVIGFRHGHLELEGEPCTAYVPDSSGVSPVTFAPLSGVSRLNSPTPVDGSSSTETPERGLISLLGGLARARWYTVSI